MTATTKRWKKLKTKQTKIKIENYNTQPDERPTDNRQRVHRTDKGSDDSVNMCSTRISSSKRRKKSTPCGYMVDGGGSGGKQNNQTISGNNKDLIETVGDACEMRE